jgi:hypothetical protein
MFPLGVIGLHYQNAGICPERMEMREIGDEDVAERKTLAPPTERGVDLPLSFSAARDEAAIAYLHIIIVID